MTNPFENQNEAQEFLELLTLRICGLLQSIPPNAIESEKVTGSRDGQSALGRRLHAEVVSSAGISSTLPSTLPVADIR